MGMSKYDRLLYILNLLRSRKNLNARRLSEECGVTERSIYRDIAALSRANIPIYYDHGYKLASKCFLPPLNFDFDEYRCLHLALDSTPLTRTPKYRSVLRRVKAKIDANVADSVKQKKKLNPLTTHVQVATTIMDDKVEKFYSIIDRAIMSWRCLRLAYDSVESGSTERVVEPYFIIFRGRAFYFVAYCRLRRDFRTFRIDRILDVTLLSEQFKVRPDIHPSLYFEGSWAVGSGDPVEVAARFRGAAARVVATGKHHPSESVETVAPDVVLYRVVTRGLDEIQRWLLGFGSDVEVISPPALRRRLARLGAYLASTYVDDSASAARS